MGQLAYNRWCWGASILKHELIAAGRAQLAAAVDTLPRSSDTHDMRAGAILSALAVVFEVSLDTEELTIGSASEILDGPLAKHLAIEAVRVELSIHLSTATTQTSEQ